MEFKSYFKTSYVKHRTLCKQWTFNYKFSNSSRRISNTSSSPNRDR